MANDYLELYEELVDEIERGVPGTARTVTTLPVVAGLRTPEG
jgi:hypothetical protein